MIALVGRESSLCIQPWLPKFSSCVFLGVIPGFRGGTIVWCLFCAMRLLYVCALVVRLDVTDDSGSAISMTTLSPLEGGGVDLSTLDGCWWWRSGQGLWLLQ